MPSTPAQTKASKKYNDKHKLENKQRDRKYYENHCERLKLKRRLRYAKQKQNKAEYNSDLSQSAAERIPHLIQAHLAELSILQYTSRLNLKHPHKKRKKNYKNISTNIFSKNQSTSCAK